MGRPPVPYFGGKIQIAPLIVSVMPDHSHYVEPFCGSLSVLFAKAPAPHETVNDLDEKLVTFWRVLRDRPGEFIRLCALTPHSRVEYDQALPLDATEDLEVARQVFVKLTQGRAGRMRRTGWRRYVTGDTSGSGLPDYLAGYVGRLAAAAERLQHVSLECRPALEMIEQYGRDPAVLLYVDPPYLASTRSRTDRSYRHEMLTEPEHRELAEALHAARAAVVLSGYASDLYDKDLYAGWHRHTLPASTGQGGVWSNRTEVLWSNRTLGRQLDLFELEASR